jgi:membrane protein implicated in regulation of membrane protease activity
MQFHVPQFIDVEDKIFGPLTFRQFVYVAGGAGICVTIYFLIPSPILAWPLMAVAAGLAGALAFYRLNNKPFIYTLQAAFSYLTNSRLYLWQRQEHKDKSKQEMEREIRQVQQAVSDISNRRADNLNNKAWQVDVSGGGTPAPEPTHTSPNRSPS